MRKKKNNITPAPVETDFYTEALKAFDVILPPSEEELEAQHQAEEEKARKRTRRLRAAILAVVAVTVALVLWRPWESLGEPQPTLPPYGESIMSDMKLTFHVYTVPGSYGVSMVPPSSTVKLSREQMDSLLERLQALQWSPTYILSSIPPAPIGDFTIIREGQQHQVWFNGYGTLTAGDYMARPDTALWNDLFTLLQQQLGQPPTGGFVTQLTDGSELYLDIQKDGSFAAKRDQTIVYRGNWAAVDDYLLLYTNDPRIGFAILRVGNDGGLTYLESHDFWLLKELKGCGPLYPATEPSVTDISMQLTLYGLEDGLLMRTVDLKEQQLHQLSALLENAAWKMADPNSPLGPFNGWVRWKWKEVGETAEKRAELSFSYDGMITDANLYAQLDDEAWMAFVEFLALTGSNDLAFRMYRPVEDGDGILLVFGMDGRFEYRHEGEAVMGVYLQLGDVVLLAGPDGLREILLWDRETGSLTTQSGEILQQIPMLYGTS